MAPAQSRWSTPPSERPRPGRPTRSASPFRTCRLQRASQDGSLSVHSPPNSAGGSDLKIFISWSGEPSRQIARALRDWLSMVVQHVEPWMSDEEIQSGTRWNDSIARSLDETNFGIVCATRANQAAPWLMFEAGALAKRLEQARVVPLCLDLEPSDITSPLQAFQARRLNEDGMRRLVYELSELAENPRPRESIDALFDAMWPRLQAAVTAAATATAPPGKPRRTSEDMLAELVTRVRSIERDIEHRDAPLREIAALRDRLAHSEQAVADAMARAEMAYVDRAQAEKRMAELEARVRESMLLAEVARRELHKLEKEKAIPATRPRE
ncbi:toll/interleukin-1 receptor domain-containing protein [Micromonospora taraxaci]|uniref:toll/interleukin-1 receptor domain-containing protein n=1 Tax=Micromonospora taraxaci TaxID=1316803 RepID=UPI0033A55287